MLKFKDRLELVMVTEQIKRIIAIFVLILFLIVFIGVSDYIFKGMSLYESIVGAISRIFGVSEGATGLGKGFISIILTLVAASAVYYLISILIDIFLEIKLTDVLMMSKVSMLKNHYIVCGAGRVGSNAAEKLSETKKPFVVIEKDCDIAKELKSREGWLVINGDCTDEYILQKAGIKKAKGIICALGDNEDNFYLIITAKQMNQDIKIAARANSDGIAKKMQAVGAEVIVTPEVVGGRKLATSITEL
jgi:voltage-gated potassium channel